MKTADNSCLSKLPFPSQSYLWKNGFKIFVNLEKDFSEAQRGVYCVEVCCPVSTCTVRAVKQLKMKEKKWDIKRCNKKRMM